MADDSASSCGPRQGIHHGQTQRFAGARGWHGIFAQPRDGGLLNVFDGLPQDEARITARQRMEAQQLSFRLPVPNHSARAALLRPR